jgi:hypothetical protein
MNFIFIVCLVGLVLAVFQDFKRREIDDWLNLFLLFSGILVILLFREYNIASLGFFIFLTAGISFLFTKGRVFSGGDSKLLFALSPFFYSFNFVSSFFNFGIFIFLLLLSGSIYGVVYSLFFFIKNFSKVKKYFLQILSKKYSIGFFILAFIFLVLGFFDYFFILFAVFILFIIILFSITLSLDKNVMNFELSTRDLWEEDILTRDLRVGKIIFKSGKRLNSDQVDFLRKKNLRCIIKDGIPYALSFLIAFIFYAFRNKLFSYFF